MQQPLPVPQNAVPPQPIPQYSPYIVGVQPTLMPFAAMQRAAALPPPPPAQPAVLPAPMMLAEPVVTAPPAQPQAPGTYSVGAAVVCSYQGVYYEAIVSATSQRSKKRKLTTMYKVKYDGFSAKWDEWVEAERLQPMTGETLGLAKATQAAAEAADKADEVKEEPKKPPAKAPRKAGKSGARTNHPAYEEMVLRAIEGLKDKTGSSAVAVGKWIKDRFAVNESKYKQSVAQALKALVAQDRLVKIKASFKLSVDELRSRTGQPLQQRRRGSAGPLDDLDVEAKQRAKGANVPQRPMPQAALALAPPAAAGDVLCVAEFCRTFNETLGSNLKLTASELEGALSLLPISETPVGADQDLLLTVATPLPPLLERLYLALLRTVCGRDARDGNFFKPKDDVACVERELFVGHMQNRRVWGHLLNAVTLPDVLRRHLAAERRFRKRVREAFPGDDNTSHASIRDDDPALKAALEAYCDQGRSLGSLPPEQCAALLRSLVDDSLDTPAIQRLMRNCEFALDQIQKRHKNAATQYKRLERLVISPSLAASPSSGEEEALKVLVRGKTPAELERVMESARGDIDAARNEWNKATSTLCLRKDTLGFDRAFSGYWKLDCLDNERVAVRLDPRDARYGVTLAPWNCFDLGVRDGALLKSLDTRGVREAALHQTFKSLAGERPALNVKQMLKASQEASHRLQLAARRHCDVAKVRPPPTNAVAAALPWPGKALPVVEEEAVVDDDMEDDDDEPRRSTRINVPDAPPSKPAAKVPDEDGTSLKAIERRAERAADLAAPWRWSHTCLADGFPAIRAQMNAILDRLDRVNTGCLGESSGRANRNGNPCSLAALCADALDAEAALASFLAPHDARQLDDADDDDDEQNNTETNGNANGNANNTVDWVEIDMASENDYYELCGPCAEVRSWRLLWRRAVESCTSPGPLETVAARFASLFGSLAEAVERHAPAVEARARAAATLLADNGKANIGGLGAVFIPSDPTADMVWARIRGYPWWPAQVHRPKGANFRAALQARNSTLLVFVGEAVQYLLHANAVEPFTGQPDDPRLPKDLKKASKGLLSALKLAKTLQDKALAANNAKNDGDVDDGVAAAQPQPQDTVVPPGDEPPGDAVPMNDGPTEPQHEADVPTMNGDRMIEE